MNGRGLTVLTLAWLWAAALVLALGGQSMASPVLQEQKYAVESPQTNNEGARLFRDQELATVLKEMPTGDLRWTMRAGIEPMDYYIITMMHDEDWSNWQDFVRFESKVIPLGSAWRVLYLVSAGFMEKRPLSIRSEEPQLAKAYVQVLRRMYYKPDPREVGFLRIENPAPLTSRWSLYGFLMEDKGLFSGRPWSWENFLPRFFAMGGMLVGGLLAIEFLRFIVSMGLRLGSRRKSGLPETREGP